MDKGRVQAGPGINVRFAKMIEREEAKATTSREADHARNEPSSPSDAVANVPNREMDAGRSRWDKILWRIREGLFAEEKR